jgi:hypothetical protein
MGIALFVVVVACEVDFLCCVSGFVLVGSRALQPWLACVRSGYLGQTLAIEEAPCPFFSFLKIKKHSKNDLAMRLHLASFFSEMWPSAVWQARPLISPRGYQR